MSTIFGNAGTKIYIRQFIDNSIKYSSDQENWTTITFPCILENTSPGNGTLKVEFVTNVEGTQPSIFLTNATDYFEINSDNIQFGSTDLEVDGFRVIIGIDGVLNYPGLIKNGDNSNGGKSNIKIYNLDVRALNGSSLNASTEAGWVCQSFFGKGATGNYVINCTSDGDVNTNCGGIVGSYSGSELGAELKIIGCTSSGDIEFYGGGIVGGAAGTNGGSVECEQCLSTGTMNTGAGGIFGQYAGINGYASAYKCYSTGAIGMNGGGIFGAYGGTGLGGGVDANTCYSTGFINSSGGGIFGIYAGTNNGTTSTTNCYTTGSIEINAGGIYGTDAENSTIISSYVTGDVTGGTGYFFGESSSAPATCSIIESYSEAENSSSGWSTTNALQVLTGVSIGGIGEDWVELSTNTPYIFNGVGYTPYTKEVINTTPTLVQEYSQTIEAGQTTVEAVTKDASGNNFTLLQSDETIVINSQTGAITATSDAILGTYTVFVLSNALLTGYFITRFYLTVIAPTPSTPYYQIPLDFKGLDYTIQNQIKQGNLLLGEENRNIQYTSYTDYIYKKMAAYATRR